MEYRLFQDTYIVRLDRGEEITECLTKLCEQEDIRIGSVTALGASDHAVIGLYNVQEKQYHKTQLDEAMEITSLVGNITRKDGEVYLHLHINLCNGNMQVYGGHMNECRISATCEMVVRRLDGEVGRMTDPVTGLNLFRFS